MMHVDNAAAWEEPLDARLINGLKRVGNWWMGSVRRAGEEVAVAVGSIDAVGRWVGDR